MHYDLLPIARMVLLCLLLSVLALEHRQQLVRTARRCSSRVRHRIETVASDVEHFFATAGGAR